MTPTIPGARRGALATAVLALALGAGVSGCQIAKHELKLPEGDEAAVLLLSLEMPQPISGIARHAWFAVKAKGDSRWRRLEVGGFSSDPLGGTSGRRDVVLHAIWRGETAERAISCFREHARAAHPRGGYLPWPGPNSNTFVDRLLRKCGLRADLPATAIGKDYRGLIGASWTSGGTGLQIETPLVGFKLGLTEGIELHFFGFAFGIDLWPPALIVPFGSGRVGFADR